MSGLSSTQESRQNPNQEFHIYSFAVNTEAGAAGSVKAASEAHGGRCPDAMFLCAGAARPGFFVDQDEALLKKQMEETYWAQALSALVRGAAKTTMCADNRASR